MEANAGHNQYQRISEANKVVDSAVPPLRGLRKDHKKVVDPVLGPPNRPFLNAGLGPNANLGNIQARFLRPVKAANNKVINTEVCSTEEVKRRFMDYNANVNIEQVTTSVPEVRSHPHRACRGPTTQSNCTVIGSIYVAALLIIISLTLALLI